MKKFLLTSAHWILLTSVFLVNCTRETKSKFSIPLGEFAGKGLEHRMFKVDAQNYDAYPWRLCLAWNPADSKDYRHAALAVAIENTGEYPIISSQNTGMTSGTTSVVMPSTAAVVYHGSLSSFIGLERDHPPSELNFRVEGPGRIKCNLKMKLENIAPIQPLRVGLCRSEPAF